MLCPLFLDLVAKHEKIKFVFSNFFLTFLHISIEGFQNACALIFYFCFNHGSEKYFFKK